MKDDERFYWFVKLHMKWLSERIGEERCRKIVVFVWDWIVPPVVSVITSTIIVRLWLR